MAIVRRLAALALLLVSAAPGCSGKGDPQPSPDQRIGPAGGTITDAATGVSVTVPPGALSTAVAITVAATGTSAANGNPVFAFGPAGTTFASPVAVKLPRPASLATGAAASVYWTQAGSSTQYEALAATVADDGVTAHPSHFSQAFVGAACTDGATCAPAGAECQAGAFSCSTGAPVCTSGGAAADGTPCTGGLCVTGTCVSPDLDLAALGTVHTYRVTQAANPTAPTTQTIAVVDTSPGAFTRHAQNADGSGSDNYWLAGPTGSFLAGNRIYNSAGTLTQTSSYAPPTILLPPLSSVGTAVTTVSTATTNGVASTQTRSVRVTGVESVTVPFGTRQAVKVLTLQGDPPTSSAENWWVPGVGRVKIANYSSATPGGTPTTLSELVSVANACTGAADGTTCGRATACGAAGSCQSGQCVAGGPSSCDDADPCTADTCSVAGGGCVHTPYYEGTSCGAGMSCQAGTCAAGTSCSGFDLLLAPLAPREIPVHSDPPAALGGTVLEGTYHITAEYWYDGPGGTGTSPGGGLRGTMVIQGGAMERATAFIATAETVVIRNSASSYSTSGTSLSFAFTCPGAASISWPYTAVGNQLKIYDGAFETVWTRQ